MADYALVNLVDNAVIEMRAFTDLPPDVARKGIRWLPIAITDPAFDPATEVRTGPVVSVLADRVTKVWTVRAMTSDELDAVKGAAVDALDALALKIAFTHENRIRALEGKAGVSAAQFRTALKAML